MRKGKSVAREEQNKDDEADQHQPQSGVTALWTVHSSRHQQLNRENIEHSATLGYLNLSHP